MDNSSTHSTHSRPIVARFGKIVSAGAFALLIGAFAIGTARADHGHHGDYHGHGHEGHHEYYGHGYDRGPDLVYGNPGYYYAPPPNYYYEPDPYDYDYYPPGPGYYPPPGPSEGIVQFFGL